MAENKRSTSPYRRLREPIDFSYIQPIHKNDIQLVWIERHYREDDLGPLLQEIDSSAVFFDNLTSAIEYLTTNKDSKQFFVVVFDEFCEKMIELSEHLSQVHHIFIYCLNLTKYKYLKDKSLKLLTICEKKPELINAIVKARNSASRDIVSQYSMRSLTKESATFIWFQLLKSLLTNLTTTDEEIAMNDFKEQIKAHHHDNETQREKLLEQFKNYKSEDAICWYTRDASLSVIINKALRQQDTDLLYKCRYFIRDLSTALTNSRQNLRPTSCVYRGAVLSRESFDKLKHVASLKDVDSHRNLVSTFGYWSTSTNVETAKIFAYLSDSNTDDNMVSVIFEIDIDHDSNVTAVDISSYSDFPYEEEVLFDIDSIFEVLSIDSNEQTRVWTIHMRTSSYGSELLNEYLCYNNRELDQLGVELLFGRLITNMGEYDKAIRYFERLVDKDSIDQINLRINLGRAYALKGDYDNARKYYLEAKDLETNKNSPKMAEIIKDLGSLDDTLGDYTAAIEKYRESLELYNKSPNSEYWRIKGDLHLNIAKAQTTLAQFDDAREELIRSEECINKADLPSNHPDLLQHQMNLGIRWQRIGNYDKASEHYNKALEMSKSALPPGHLDIGTVLYRLGSAAGEAGNYLKALDYFHQSLVIVNNAVGEEHPSTVIIWSGIANVYQCRDEHEQGLKYQLKTLELYQKIYDNKDHEDIARVLNNLGELYRRMKDYEKAFSYLYRALEMRRKLLGPDHYDTGTVHVNLAETYRDAHDYQKALEHAERGVKLWKEQLLPDASGMDEGKELLEQLRKLISEKGSVDKTDESNIKT